MTKTLQGYISSGEDVRYSDSDEAELLKGQIGPSGEKIVTDEEIIGSIADKILNDKPSCSNFLFSHVFFYFLRQFEDNCPKNSEEG